MSVLAVGPSLLDDLLGYPRKVADSQKPAPVGGERTLDDVIVGAWEALSARLTVDCPVCDGELVPEYGAHSRPVGGRCGKCGCELS